MTSTNTATEEFDVASNMWPDNKVSWDDNKPPDVNWDKWIKDNKPKTEVNACYVDYDHFRPWYGYDRHWHDFRPYDRPLPERCPCCRRRFDDRVTVTHRLEPADYKEPNAKEDKQACNKQFDDVRILDKKNTLIKDFEKFLDGVNSDVPGRDKIRDKLKAFKQEERAHVLKHTTC